MCIMTVRVIRGLEGEWGAVDDPMPYTVLPCFDMCGGQDAQEVDRRLRRQPITWDEARNLIPGNLSGLARSREQETAYRAGRARIKDEWESIYDYLLVTKFGFDWTWGEGAPVVDTDDSPGTAETTRLVRRKRSRPTHREYFDNLQFDDGTQLRFCPNDFPYYFESGIEHHVLWKLGGDVTDEEVASAKAELLDLNSVGRELSAERLEQISNGTDVFLSWVNPPSLKSLPGIDHVHILLHKPGLSRL